MKYLKILAATLPFLLAGMGALLMATMMSVEPEPERLPIAYMRLDYEIVDSNYRISDLRVMDVLSGEVIFEGDELGCPENISSNNRWLIYISGGRGPRKYTLVDLYSGETTPFPFLHRIINWEGDTVIYSVGIPNVDEEFSYFRHNVVTDISEQILTFSSPPFPRIMQWIDGELVYVIQDEGQLIVYRGEETSEAFLLPEGFNGGLSMSFDTRYLLFRVRNASSEREYQILDTQTGEIVTIINGSRIHWKPNANEVGYVNTDRDIVIYDVTTQEVSVFDVQLDSIFTVYITGFRWSPNGRHIAYQVHHEGYHAAYTNGQHVTGNESYSFHILDTTTEETHQLASYVSVENWSMRWLSETKLLYADADASYVQTDAGHFRPANADLWLYDTAIGELTQLIDTPNIDEKLFCIRG